MKLSYTINRWNDKSWSELCDAARSSRLQGIEIAGVTGTLFQGKGSPTNPELSAVTRRTLYGSGLCIPCVNTILDYMDPAFDREFAESVRVAVNLGIDAVGIHTKSSDREAYTKKVGSLLEAVGMKPVTVLVETTGVFTDTAKLRDLLNHFADDHLAALWNMYGSFAEGDEQPETTITNLGAYVRHVHIHDFRKEGGALVPELTGEGQLPIGEMMNALRSVNYDGFISIEWDPA